MGSGYGPRGVHGLPQGDPRAYGARSGQTAPPLEQAYIWSQDPQKVNISDEMLRRCGLSSSESPRLAVAASV